MMQVWYEGRVVNAKRFRDLTTDEVKLSTNSPYLWDGDEIFIEPDNEHHSWRYMYDEQVKIISE